MFYEITNNNNRGKYIIGQKNCINSQNELLIFVISLKLTNTFKPFLKISLRTLFQTRFKILHCYRMSNNPLTYNNVSLSLSLTISIYEFTTHNIYAIQEIQGTTCYCAFNEHKIFNHLVSYATQ